MSNYGDFIVDYSPNQKKDFKHIYDKIDTEMSHRKKEHTDICSDIYELKQELLDEVNFRKFILKMISCDNVDIVQTLQIRELREHIDCLSKNLEQANIYINDLYWTLYQNRPAVIGPIIAPLDLIRQDVKANEIKCDDVNECLFSSSHTSEHGSVCGENTCDSKL